MGGLDFSFLVVILVAQFVLVPVLRDTQPAHHY